MTLDVPHSARGSHEVLVEAELPPGPYIAELVIADPWMTVTRPPRTRADIARVEIGTEADRRRRAQTLDPSQPHEHLELLLLGASADARQLESFPDDALADVAVAIVDLVTADATATVDSRALGSLRQVLFREPDRLPHIVADLHADGRLDGPDLLRLGIVTLTDALDCPLEFAGPEERERLMSVAPLLGAALDGWSASEESSARWREQLGWAPTLGGDELPSPGGPVERFMLDWDSLRVATLRDVLDHTEAGLLSHEGFVDGVLSWLQRHNGDAVRRWQDAFHVFNDARARGSDQHVRFLDAVTPAPGTPPVARFPADLLSAAIHLTGFGLNNARAAAGLLAAVDLAPELVARSLLVAIVLHRRFS